MATTDFAHRVQQFITSHHILQPQDRVLVGLSGGSDSVALLRVLLELGYTCHAAHCNFHLRAEESDRDEQFVRSLCDRLGVALLVKPFDVERYVQRQSVSVEMACRELRYTWFEETRRHLELSVTAVGHHHDDNLETMLLNLLRGTGIAGLTGMKPVNHSVVRPLLGVSHTEVLDYLQTLNQPFITDSSNLENIYARNKIRNLILPAMERAFPTARKGLETTMSNLADAESLQKWHIKQVLESARITNGYEIQPLLQHPQAKLLFQAALKPFGFSMHQCQEIIACQRTHPRNHPVFYSRTHCLTLGTTTIIIDPLHSGSDDTWPVDLHATESLPITLTTTFINAPFAPSMCDGKNIVAFTQDVLKQPLVLRHWRQGDTMRPFGMHGTRKLSDIFTDLHYTREQKKRAWVLETNGTIIWIPGVRSADAYRVTPGTTDYVLLNYAAEAPH